MGSYQGNRTWQENVYQFETTDVVIGGPDGKDNRPLKELADRTTWLKNAMRGFNEVLPINGDSSLTYEQILQRMVIINANQTAVACTLPQLSAEQAGTVVSIMVWNLGRFKQATIIGPNDLIMYKSAVGRTNLYLSDGESVQLVWVGDRWFLFSHDSNMDMVGEALYGYSEMLGTVPADGRELYRADYPRLFEYASSLGSSIIADSEWIYTPNNVARGFFSYGSNPTLFRVPDLRGMFIRSIDFGRGIDLDRSNPNPGSYEADELKSHDHKQDLPNTQGSGGNFYEQNYLRSGGDRGLWYGANKIPTSKTGGNETRPKNIGLIPLIRT